MTMDLYMPGRIAKIVEPAEYPAKHMGEATDMRGTCEFCGKRPGVVRTWGDGLVGGRHGNAMCAGCLHYVVMGVRA